MADVKNSDENKLMTSDEFIAAAKERADKNLQIQKDLAKDIYDSSYASLENAYKDTEATAATARDRNIINADTEYKLSEMKYGAAEEALAGAGLSGSGLSEYQRAQAYAKSRDEKQASYAEYDRVMREAAYNRDQGKLSADIKYKQDVADADIGYNNTMTSLGEKELGYDTLEKQAIDSSYNDFIDGINNGTMTLDQIKNDSYWSKLSPKQQKAVETASAVKGFKTRIDNGESIEDITSSYGYADLSGDAQNEIQGYYASVQAGKTSEAQAALGRYLEMAKTGWSIDSILAQATNNGHYDTLNESGAWKQVIAEANKYTADAEKADVDANFATAIDLLSKGATLEEIKEYFGGAESDAWKALEGSYGSEISTQAKVINRLKEEDIETNAKNAITDYLELVNSGVSIDDITTIAKGLGHYDTLTKVGEDGTSLWDAVTKKAEKTENLTAIDTMIKNGDSTEEIKGSDEYKSLDEPTRAEVDKTLANNEKNVEAYVSDLITKAAAYNTPQELESALNMLEISDEIKERVKSGWQETNTAETLDGLYNAEYTDGRLLINGEEITGEEIAEDLNSGMFGAGGSKVVKQYVTSLIEMVKNAENGTNAYNWAIEQIDALRPLASEAELEYYAPVTDAGFTRAENGSIVSAYSAHGQLYEEVGETDEYESKALDSQGGKNATTIKKNNTVYLKVGSRKNGVGYWVEVKTIDKIT